MTRSRFPLLALALVLSLPGSAYAADPQPEASASAGTGQASRKADKEDMGDPNRIICRKIETIGSRVHTQRICASAAQWSAMRDQNRQGLDRIQTERYMHNEGG